MKTAEEFLNESFEPTGKHCRTVKEDLQLAITLNPDIDRIIECMKNYAHQVAEELLITASKNAMIHHEGGGEYSVDKDSITETEIILP